MLNNVQNPADVSLVDRFASKPQQAPVDKAAEDFEAMFMAQMLQPIFDTVGVNPLFGGGHGEEMMRGFLVQEYGKELARSSSFGIAASVQEEMARKKDAANPQHATQVYGAINGIQPH